MSRFLELICGLYKTTPYRRLKTCRWCEVQFSDVTPRNLRTCCSYDCERSAGTSTRHKNGTYSPTKEQRRIRSKQMIELHKNDPSIAAKISISVKIGNTPEVIKKRIASVKKHNQEFGHWTQTEKGKQRLSVQQLGKPKSDSARQNMSRGAQQRMRSSRELHTSANGGTRHDLGRYFRSNWEANFARILNFHERVWTYEEKTFQLTETMSYTPDFYLADENVFYELKGIMNERSQDQLNLMQSIFPDVKIVLIDWKKYEMLKKTYKNLINWEGK